MASHLRLYDILAVESSATPKEIQRAYRMLALRVHPDKNPGDANAIKNFQQLLAAYNILKDPAKRRRYDETGCEEEETDDFRAAYEAYKVLFPRVTPTDIQAFEARYKGSAEELDDLVDFYNSNNGNVSKLFECVLLAEPDDCNRFIDLFHQLIKDGRIKTTPSFKKTVKQLPKIAERYRKKYKNEGDEVEGAGSSMADLILAVQANRDKRAVQASNFLSGLEEKYAKKKTKKS